MSEPVTNHDIEDVLSSIRRLVSQGNRETQVETPEKQLRAVETPSPNRLVLTPAFRIRDEPVDSPEPQLLKMPPDFSRADDTAKADDADATGQATLETTIAELEAAVTESYDEWEPDGTDGPLESSVTSAFLYKLDARQAKATEAKSTEDTVADAVTDHIAETISDEIARGLPANDAIAEDAENDAELVEVDASAALAYSDLHFDEVYDPVAEATADAAEKELGDIFGDELAEDSDDQSFDVATTSNAQLVDPDALRSMVSEMIRAELQGEMGERITRNVRNLVRREINRVITEQDV